jgi:hypothetical protein
MRVQGGLLRRRGGGERCGGDGDGDGEEARARRRVAVEVEPNGAMWEAGVRVGSTARGRGSRGSGRGQGIRTPQGRGQRSSSGVARGRTPRSRQRREHRTRNARKDRDSPEVEIGCSMCQMLLMAP